MSRRRQVCPYKCVVGHEHGAVGAHRQRLSQRVGGLRRAPSRPRPPRPRPQPRAGGAPPRPGCRSKSESARSPLRSRRPLEGSSRRPCAASGTAFTQTAIFTLRSHRGCTLRPGPPGRSVHRAARRSCRNSTISPVAVPGVNTAATPLRPERLGVVARDRAPDEDEDLVRSPLAQQVDDARDEGHVGAREDRDPDRVCVLLDRGLDDLLGKLVQARVDHLHAGVTERPGDHLRAAVVPVEADLGDHDPDRPAIAASRTAQRSPPGSQSGSSPPAFAARARMKSRSESRFR